MIGHSCWTVQTLRVHTSSFARPRYPWCTSRAPSPQEGEKQIKDLVEVVFYLQEEILKLSPENRDRDRDAAPDPAKPRTGPGRKKAPG